MWSPVTSIETSEPAPASRCKHSATLLQGHVYLLGGRNGNVPLKDFWRYSLADGKWTQVQASGERPPCLQEHTAVAWKDQIYVFGGEVGFSSGTETPLWVYSSTRDSWRKVRARRGVQVPRARRGHTALVHRGAMLVYGGYQDLRGSSADLWAFHFETESWHLLSAPGTGGEIPPARHRHSAILHDDCMYIYGGMTDLVARSDLWRWDTRSRCWAAVRAHGAHRPGALHGHAAAAAHSHMLLLSGDDVWRFTFDTDTWEKVDVRGDKPPAHSEAVALTVSELLLHNNANNSIHCTDSNKRQARTGTRGNNKISPCDNNTTTTTYVFPTSGAGNTSSSFISRLAQLRVGTGASCHYTVLHADSTESLLSSTPQRLPKSRSAYHHQDITTDTTAPSHTTLARDPVSVPNFTALEANKHVDTTTTTTAKLVLLNDSDEDDSGVAHHQVIQVKPANDSNKKIVIYENLSTGVARGESYSSHLAYADSTSDYASLDMSNSSSTYSQQATSPLSPIEPPPSAPGVFRTRGGGFCNPNYQEGPRKQMAALLGSNVKDEPHADLELELQNLVNAGRRRVGRAASASRAETRAPARAVPPALYIYLVGGKERQVTLFKRPLAIWKLQLY